MSDVVTLNDGRTFRVLGKRLVVELLPETRQVGMIELPDSAIASVYRRGVVRAVGQGWDGTPPEGVAVGDHCVMVRFHANVHTNEQVQERLGESTIIVEPKDVLLVCDASDRVEFT